MNGVTQWEAKEIIREKNARIEALTAENERLREALEPFARAEQIAATIETDGRIRCTLSYPLDADQTFTLESLNAARAALAGRTEQ